MRTSKSEPTAKKRVKKKTFKVTLEFDNHDSAHGFFAHWLDGGGDGGGNIDWQTDKWDNKNHTWMRIKGTGCAVDDDGTVLTPEVEEARFKERMAKFKRGDACCENEDRSFDGGCNNCGDPCL